MPKLTMNRDPLRNWKMAGVLATAVIVLSLPVYLVKESLTGSGDGTGEESEPTFVGRDKCISCHPEAYENWQGSDHDHAMAPAGPETVRGDFDDAVFDAGGFTARFFRRDDKYFVNTAGPDGELSDFEIAYTFGVEPLQQYLIPFPGGRLQCLTIAWDTEREQWFDLYPGENIPPDDWLHWTRNAQNWNGMCAECHSTNLRKGFDPDSRTYQTTWSEINVSCEACHGPGSRHLEWAELPPMARPESESFGLVIRTRGMTSRQQVELCAPCHSRRTELGDYDHAGSNLMDHLLPTLLREGLYHADGQILDEVYVYGSFVQSKMFKNDVRCSDCHDVHKLTLVRDGNELCLQCHQAAAYDTYEHHFHHKTYEGRPSDGARCVKCHMPEQLYMVVDYRADHSIRVPRPDLSLEIGSPNACSQSGCHMDRPVQWLVESFKKWYGQAEKHHYGMTLSAGRKGLPEAQPELIRLAGDPLYPTIVRATALSLLEGYPDERSTDALKRSLTDEEGLLRYTGMSSLTHLAPEELAERLAPLLFDPIKAVRLEAAAKLAGIPREMLKPYQETAFREALQEYQQAMEYSLDFSFAGMNLGNLYVNLGQSEKAAGYYLSAIEIDDLFYPAKVNLAMLYNSMGRNEEAEALLGEVVTQYPEMVDTAYSLGLLLAEMGRYEEAAVYLERASDGLPQRARIHYNLGLVLQHLQRVGEAETALMKAIDVEPENPDHLYALADHYAKRGELGKALAFAERLVDRHPEDPAGRDIKAFIERSIAAQD